MFVLLLLLMISKWIFGSLMLWMVAKSCSSWELFGTLKHCKFHGIGILPIYWLVQDFFHLLLISYITIENVIYEIYHANILFQLVHNNWKQSPVGNNNYETTLQFYVISRWGFCPSGGFATVSTVSPTRFWSNAQVAPPDLSSALSASRGAGGACGVSGDGAGRRFLGVVLKNGDENMEVS